VAWRDVRDRRTLEMFGGRKAVGHGASTSSKNQRVVKQSGAGVREDDDIHSVGAQRTHDSDVKLGLAPSSHPRLAGQWSAEIGTEAHKRPRREQLQIPAEATTRKGTSRCSSGAAG
jgi:hypothetical protein